MTCTPPPIRPPAVILRGIWLLTRCEDSKSRMVVRKRVWVLIKLCMIILVCCNGFYCFDLLECKSVHWKEFKRKIGWYSSFLQVGN